MVSFTGVILDQNGLPLLNLFQVSKENENCHGRCASLADPLLGNMFVLGFFALPLSLSLFRRGDAHCGLPLLAHTPALITTPAAD